MDESLDILEFISNMKVDNNGQQQLKKEPQNQQINFDDFLKNLENMQPAV